jgi:TrmH RNA methyltransferase
MSGTPHAPRHAQQRQQQHQQESEILYGLRAGLALFRRRPDDVLRVAFAPGVRAEVAELARSAASRHLPCEELPERELDRIAESTHHEGLVLLARPRRWATPNELGDAISRGAARGVTKAAIALDRVRNPHNIGAILRSAAFFGFEGALLGSPAPHPELTPAAVRVAEGGAEELLVSRTTDLAHTLGKLRARGVQVVGADGHAKQAAAGFPFRRPVMLVLGHEREGLGDRVRAECDAFVAIRGGGAVESLNVAVAAGVLFAEVVRGVR